MDYKNFDPTDAIQQKLFELEQRHYELTIGQLDGTYKHDVQPEIDAAEQQHAAILAANPEIAEPTVEAEAAKLAANHLEQQAIQKRAQELIEQADTDSVEGLLAGAEALREEPRASRR